MFSYGMGHKKIHVGFEIDVYVSRGVCINVFHFVHLHVDVAGLAG